MKIETNSPRVLKFRKQMVELLLSEHQGACESLCKVVCPQQLDIPRFLWGLAKQSPDADFYFDPNLCAKCDEKCEKACRRGRHDEVIAIRKLLSEAPTKSFASTSVKTPYNHLWGAVASEDLDTMVKECPKIPNSNSTAQEAARCLQCACSAKDNCALRDVATLVEAKQINYKAASPAPYQIITTPHLIFEPGKCVRCGRCVRLGELLQPDKGPVMSYRGKEMMITPPLGADFNSVFENYAKEFIAECPTAALGPNPQEDLD